MVETRLRAGVFALLMVLAGCGGSPTAPGEVPYGQRFALEPGERVTVGDDGLAVRFETVKSDSRCPLDAVCIDIGDAVIAIAVERDGRTESRDIHTKPPLSELRVDRFTVTLEELQPYPWSNRPVVPADYTATLTVDRR